MAPEVGLAARMPITRVIFPQIPNKSRLQFPTDGYKNKQYADIFADIFPAGLNVSGGKRGKMAGLGNQNAPKGTQTPAMGNSSASRIF